MHGPRWGRPEDELRAEYACELKRNYRLGTENYVLAWLLAEARWHASTPGATPQVVRL